MLGRRVSTGHKGDGGRSLFSRFLAATTTRRYAFRLTPSRRRPFQAREIRYRHFVRRADNERCKPLRPAGYCAKSITRRSGTTGLPLHGGHVPAWHGPRSGPSSAKPSSTHPPQLASFRLPSSPRVTEIARVGWTIAGLRRRALLLRASTRNANACLYKRLRWQRDFSCRRSTRTGNLRARYSARGGSGRCAHDRHDVFS